MGISHPSQCGHRPSAAGAAVTVNIEGGTLIGHHRPDPGHLLQGQILTAGNVAVGVLLPGPVSYTHLDVYKRQAFVVPSYSF